MARNEIRVGVLIDTLDDYFQRALVERIIDAGKAGGFHLLFIPGHVVNAKTNFERQFNILYAFARSAKLDAIISATEHFQNHISNEECRRFLEQFSTIPLINLNFEMPGTSSVMIDNRAGFRPLMRHLICEHQYKKFTFMKGIESTEDAQERFDEFLCCLSEARLVFNPELVVTGNFNQTDGRVAMMQLLDKDIPFDVFVCANDGMAHAAIAVAVERGLRIPQDFAVTGFDDVLTFAKLGLPLTTVAQPFQSMAENAFALVRERVELQKCPSVISVPTRLVVRQTCGCVAVVKVRQTSFTTGLQKNNINQLIDGRSQVSSATGLMDRVCLILQSYHMLSINFQRSFPPQCFSRSGIER